jgi:hypothetical protein
MFIIIYLTVCGFCINLTSNIIHDNYLDICEYVDQEYSPLICVFGSVDAKLHLNFNSSVSAEENEENLGRAIGKCYLNPLCFKLEIPENASR